MELYTISEEYINYLRKFSKNVKYNKNESRPYIGVVLEINEYNYFAPLGSPKLKHIEMKESLDFIKIEKGELGVINLNNMIPVPKDNITNIQINTLSDEKYAILLENQLRWIERNEESIISKSFKLYKLITTKENTVFHKRSNDFKFLEEKYLEYIEELKKEINEEKENTEKSEANENESSNIELEENKTEKIEIQEIKEEIPNEEKDKNNIEQSSSEKQNSKEDKKITIEKNDEISKEKAEVKEEKTKLKKERPKREKRLRSKGKEK